jgi:cysteine desulfurase
MFGGSQENGLRPGTQDVAGIVGFAEAVKVLGVKWKKEDKVLEEWRDKIVAEVKKRIPGVLLNGHPTERLANNINFSIPGVNAEELVVAMDEAGFALSTRSACDSKNAEPPHVIKAIGRTDEEARSAARITLGRFTTSEDVDRFIEVFIEKINYLRNRN